MLGGRAYVKSSNRILNALLSSINAAFARHTPDVCTNSHRPYFHKYAFIFCNNVYFLVRSSQINLFQASEHIHTRKRLIPSFLVYPYSWTNNETRFERQRSLRRMATYTMACEICQSFWPCHSAKVRMNEHTTFFNIEHIRHRRIIAYALWTDEASLSALKTRKQIINDTKQNIIHTERVKAISCAFVSTDLRRNFWPLLFRHFALFS